MNPCVCGVPEGYIEALVEGARGLPQWNKNPVTWTVAQFVPPFSADEYRDICARAFAALSAVCGLDFLFADGPADITKYAGPIDGVGGTLAWSEIAQGNRPLQQKFDTAGPSGAWGAQLMLLTQEHEDIHALGIGHGPQGSLMAPSLNGNLPGPQEWDIYELQRRYGPRRGAPPTAPPEPGNKITVEIYNADKIVIPGYKVTKL